MMTYINPDEVIKRLAASSGIDALNLVKSQQEVQGAAQQQQQAQQDLEIAKQASQFERNSIEANARNTQGGGGAEGSPQAPPQAYKIMYLKQRGPVRL